MVVGASGNGRILYSLVLVIGENSEVMRWQGVNGEMGRDSGLIAGRFCLRRHYYLSCYLPGVEAGLFV